jgi:membrane protein implicated in regulation of membrane protease activity
VTEQVVLAAIAAAAVILAIVGLGRVIDRRRGGAPVPGFGAGGSNRVPPGSEGVARTGLTPSGVVYVAGEDWTARSASGRTIAEGDRVRVVGQQGLTLIVDAEPIAAPPE